MDAHSAAHLEPDWEDDLATDLLADVSTDVSTDSEMDLAAVILWWMTMRGKWRLERNIFQNTAGTAVFITSRT